MPKHKAKTMLIRRCKSVPKVTFLCTRSYAHVCARKTILGARKSVHANVKFIKSWKRNRSWKDKCWNKFRYSCIHQNNLIDMERDIKRHWCSSGVFTVNFEKIPQLFLAFHCWIWESVASCFYQQRSKYRQVKITKHESKGTNFAILTKWVKVQHETKPATNLKCMHIVGFEQRPTKFIEIFVS